MRIVIRVSSRTLHFSVADSTAVGGVRMEPYTVKSGMSMAANLRQAFEENNLLSEGHERALVMTDAPVLLLPLEKYDEKEVATLYHYTYEGHEKDEVVTSVVPQLGCVAAMAVNKDLKLVLTDHFKDVKLMPLMQPVWEHLHGQRNPMMRRRLYAYYHDKQLDIFAFSNGRFRFSNNYHVTHTADMIYCLLFVWKSLELDGRHDELQLMGNFPDSEELGQKLRRFVQSVYFTNPSAEYNRAPLAAVKGLPYDLLTLYLK